MVTIANNTIDGVDYGIVAYTYDDTKGLNSDPVISGNTFTDIGVDGIFFDPEFGAFTTTTAFTQTGSQFAHEFYGSNGADNFSGGAGNDILDGRGGIDTTTGGRCRCRSG